MSKDVNTTDKGMLENIFKEFFKKHFDESIKSYAHILSNLEKKVDDLPIGELWYNTRGPIGNTDIQIPLEGVVTQQIGVPEIGTYLIIANYAIRRFMNVMTNSRCFARIRWSDGVTRKFPPKRQLCGNDKYLHPDYTFITYLGGSVAWIIHTQKECVVQIEYSSDGENDWWFNDDQQEAEIIAIKLSKKP